MTSTFSPRSPQVLKGAFAIYAPDEEDSDPTVLPFQYNPNQVRRQLKHRAPSNEGEQRGNNTPRTCDAWSARRLKPSPCPSS